MATTVDGGGSSPTSKPVGWSPLDEHKVVALIKAESLHSHGNVELAFAHLRDERQMPAHYFDSNLAVAADYFRARWETEKAEARGTPPLIAASVAASEVAVYMDLKRHGTVPREGPGPVSPYSMLEEKYMYKGIIDQIGLTRI